MKIEAVEAVFPSRRVTNAEVVELVREHSRRRYCGDLDKALERIEALLAYSGAEERRWLAEGETPIDLIRRAVNRCLERADCRKQDIDLLIFVGVDKGFVEPAAANFVAAALGMDRVQCCDLFESCMSWSRALQWVDALLQAGMYSRVMIVNGEFNQTHAGGAGYPAIFALENSCQIDWTFPGYTVGEAATATLLSRAPEKTWEFHFAARNDLAKLCTIPLPGYEGYCHLEPQIGRNGPGRFSSFGVAMHAEGTPEVIDIFRRLSVPRQEIRTIFPHASSKRAWDHAAAAIGVEQQLFHIYPKFGNLVSASIPAAMALAQAEGRINAGDTFAGWVGSAGMSFAAFASSL